MAETYNGARSRSAPRFGIRKTPAGDGRRGTERSAARRRSRQGECRQAPAVYHLAISAAQTDRTLNDADPGRTLSPKGRDLNSPTSFVTDPPATALTKGKSWELVFRQPDGRPVGHKRDHADWKVLLADAEVRNARLHDARHTAASLLLLLKVPARVVMDILGHSSYQLTMNTYSHVAPELNSEAARLMAGALWEAGADDEGAPRRRSGE